MRYKLFFYTTLVVVFGLGIGMYYVKNANAPSSNGAPDALSESEAKTIAEKSCLKGGEALGVGYYNENSQTWWFDANLNATPAGCSPACVVSADGKAEINWRCTGLVDPENSETELGIEEAFKLKYSDYKDTLEVQVEQEVSGYARGSIVFVSGQPGGYFFAKKQDGVWQIVFDGNGAIPCSLSEQGFPLSMLEDCAE